MRPGLQETTTSESSFFFFPFFFSLVSLFELDPLTDPAGITLPYKTLTSSDIPERHGPWMRWCGLWRQRGSHGSGETQDTDWLDTFGQGRKKSTRMKKKKGKGGVGWTRERLNDSMVSLLWTELVTETLRAWALSISKFFFPFFLCLFFLSFLSHSLAQKKVQKRALNSWDSLIHVRVSSA